MKNVLYAMIALIGGVAGLTPLSLSFLRKLKFGQFVRDDGPESHLAKAGTPTMGGLVFILVIFVAGLIASVSKPSILPILLVMVGFAIVGFIDDYIKVVKKRSLGFKAYQKLTAQLIITLAYCYYMMTSVSGGSSIIIPFIEGGATLDLGWLYIPFIVVFMLGTVNGVNLTDGVDGLATSVTIAVLGFFMVMNTLLNSDVGLVLAIGIGALLGFLLYNSHPASLFMGDTGSLALGGGLVAAVAIYMKLPLIIILVGFIYLAEVISVMIQVAYFKATKGKRFFKMAPPLHHHYELSGWKETKVVYVFTIVTVFLCMLAYTGVLLYLG